MVSIKNDTRNFCTPRQAPDADVIPHPCVDDTLKFVLPPCRRIQRRDVVSSTGQRFELWSPNSTQNPYYPGLEGKPVREPADNEEHRRFDGSLGRFDPTYVPLHFDKDRPWLGFVRRSFAFRSKDSLERQPEHMVVSMVWDSAAAPSKFGGRLQVHFIQKLRRRQAFLQETMDRLSGIETSNPWSDRPTYPSSKDLEGLDHIRTYGDAVDFVTSVQRGLKLQAAWIEMTRFVTANFGLEKELALPVDDRRIGVWINGSDQVNALWLLRAGVPCFVIHEYIADVDFPGLCRPSIADHRRQVSSRNFSDGTDMERFTDQHYNPYLIVAHQNKASFAVTLPPSIPSPKKFPKELRSLSASWRQQPSAETNSVELEEYVRDPRKTSHPSTIAVAPIASHVLPEHIPTPKAFKAEIHSSPKIAEETPVLVVNPKISTSSPIASNPVLASNPKISVAGPIARNPVLASNLKISVAGPIAQNPVLVSNPKISVASPIAQTIQRIVPSCYLRCPSHIISFESFQSGLENMAKICGLTPPIVRVFRTSKEDTRWFWVQMENENVARSIGEYFFANRRVNFSFATQSEFDDALQNCCSPTLSNIVCIGGVQMVQPNLKRDRKKDMMPPTDLLWKLVEKDMARKVAAKAARLARRAAVSTDWAEDDPPTPTKKPFRGRRGGKRHKVNRLLEQSQ